MKIRFPAGTCLLALLALAAPASANDDERPFDAASAGVHERLTASLDELSTLRQQIADETIPLGRELRDLETELLAVRAEFQQVARQLDVRTLDLSTLRGEIKLRQDEATYLSNLLSEYLRNFESRLHVAELQRYGDVLEAARLAPENATLSEREVFAFQADLLETSFGRLEGVLGGMRFPGSAVDRDGAVRSGSFVLMGPAALFRSEDGSVTGTAEQRLGSLDPAVLPFIDPEHARAATELVATGAGLFPLDPTGGNAHKFEASERETLLDEFKKGGPVMYPITALAVLTLLVVLAKALSLMRMRQPSETEVGALLAAVAAGDEPAAQERARKLRGPMGRMLETAVAHLRHPRELIEEVMYENVLATRFRLERSLPFIAISATSAPLIGLLGTVTGIISTFRMITLYGSGDVRNLSSGISEALITTKYGLIVAISALLMHALLTRKVRGVLNEMETTAVAFVNQMGRAAS